jgi:site-specific recombinase XerD
MVIAELNRTLPASPVAPQKKARPTMLYELITRYASDNEAEGKSMKTITWYTDLLKQYCRYLDDSSIIADLSAINRDYAKDYMLYLHNRNRCPSHSNPPTPIQPLSPRTIQCHTRCLKAFSTWLYEEGYTSENRLEHLKLPKAPTVVIEPLTPVEIKKLINSIDKHSPTGIRNHAILTTMLDSGLRVAEVASITLANLNLADGYVKVMGKGSKERIVPLGAYVCKILWSYIDKARPKPRVPGQNYLFLSAGGDPVSTNTLKLMFTRLAKTSGIKRLHAHLCRHTFATNYLLAGGDIFSLKEILGHSTLEMVNHYLHFTNQQVTTLQHRFSPMDRLQDGEANHPLNNGKWSTGDNRFMAARMIHQVTPSSYKQSKQQ